MPQPTASDVHVDTVLTDFSVAYAQDPNNFVSRRVFPVRRVQHQSDKYRIFTKDFFFRSESALRAPGTRGATRGYEVSTTSYYCEVYDIGQNISEQVRANADYDVEEAAALVNMQDLMIREEILFGSAAFSTGIWATESTATWNTSTGDIIGDITTAQKTVEEQTGRRANTLVLSADAWWDGLRNSTQIIDRLPNDSPRIVTEQFISNLFGIDRVFVSRGTRVTHEEGTTGTPDYIFGDHALVAYVEPNAGLMTPTAGVTFVWSGLVGSQDGFRVKRFDVPVEDAFPRIETGTAVDHKVTATDLGYLIKDVAS